MATVLGETSAKDRCVLTPQPHGGAIYRGNPKLPIPGPGLPKREVTEAKEKLKAEFEAKVHAEAEKLVQDAFAAWERGQQGPWKELADRTWGSVTQKVELRFNGTQEQTYLLLLGEAMAVLSELAPNLAGAFGEAMAARVESGAILETVRALDGSYSPAPAGSQEAEP